MLILTKNWKPVVSVLLKIRFGHAQISAPKLGVPILKTACINPWLHFIEAAGVKTSSGSPKLTERFSYLLAGKHQEDSSSKASCIPEIYIQRKVFEKYNGHNVQQNAVFLLDKFYYVITLHIYYILSTTYIYMHVYTVYIP